MDSSKNIFSDSAVRISIVGVLAILALFLFAKTWSTVEEMGHVKIGETPTISVSGTGKASTPPTIAQISFTVEERAGSEQDAQTAATKKTDAALASLKKLEIKDADIQTTGYQIYPQYETPNCKPGVPCPQSTKISNYQVSQSVTVKVRDTSKAGEVLQALGTAGVQNVSGPNFMVDDPAAVQAEARGKAITDARQKAELLAKQLGVRLGTVVSFSESGGGAMPMFNEMMAKAASADGGAPAPTIPQGENETTSNVNITYQIR
jgi:uncharacterized protein YggE